MLVEWVRSQRLKHGEDIKLVLSLAESVGYMVYVPLMILTATYPITVAMWLKAIAAGIGMFRLWVKNSPLARALGIMRTASGDLPRIDGGL